MQQLEELWKDKATKPKQKTELLSTWLLARELDAEEMLRYAEKAKDPQKATCIEALEFASQQQPALVTKEAFMLVLNAVQSKAPRVKWESAKVIANTLHLFPGKWMDVMEQLLPNTLHSGTVVRWSAAQVFLQLAKLPIKHQPQLLPVLTKLHDAEEKNSIKKIYLQAMKACKP